MNTKFTILIAAGLLFAGMTQAQGTVASDFNNKPRHEVVARHEMKKEFRKAPRHKMHHKVKHHHRKMHHKSHGHK
jgi:hypothetical protein